MKETTEVYKIRRISDGLFSAGGMGDYQKGPRFTKSGKTWSGIGPLKCHLAQFDKAKIRRFYQGCEVVAFKITFTTEEGNGQPVEEFLK